MSNEDKVLDKLKGPEHVLAIDCPDCGRTIAYRNKCGKCGGSYWLPAGYVNRRAMKTIYLDWLNRKGEFDELVAIIEKASTG